VDVAEKHSGSYSAAPLVLDAAPARSCGRGTEGRGQIVDGDTDATALVAGHVPEGTGAVSRRDKTREQSGR